MITKPVLTEGSNSGLQVALYHAEASWSLRKVLLEQGKKTVKELEKLEINDLLRDSFHSRQKTLEERLEEKFIKAHEYGRGCQHTDPN